MPTRALDAPLRRARKRATHLAATAVVTTNARALSLPPTAGAVADDAEPVSARGKDTPRFTMPEVKTGSTKPAATRPERQPSKAMAAWRKAQKDHATKPPRSGTALFAAAQDTGILSLVPEGQADAPWHRITDLAITDAPTARTDYSTGNPMLTGTDFDIAGVCRRLTLTRTYNSPDAPRGKVSQRWWQQYERHLSQGSGEVILYDNSGATVRFTKNSDGSLTTPKRYSQELRNNIDSATDAMESGSTPGNVTEYGFNTRNNLDTAPLPTGGTTTNHWQTRGLILVGSRIQVSPVDQSDSGITTARDVPGWDLGVEPQRRRDVARRRKWRWPGRVGVFILSG